MLGNMADSCWCPDAVALQRNSLAYCQAGYGLDNGHTLQNYWPIFLFVYCVQHFGSLVLMVLYDLGELYWFHYIYTISIMKNIENW